MTKKKKSSRKGSAQRTIQITRKTTGRGVQKRLPQRTAQRAIQKTTQTVVPLSRYVTIEDKQYSSSNITQDNIFTLNYLLSASTIEIIERFTFGLKGGRGGRMLSITGPYGSGKSTMAVFLNGLLAKSTSKQWDSAYKVLRTESSSASRDFMKARKKIGVHKSGLIRCMVTAKREPITVTLLRALESGARDYFGNYTTKNFAKADTLKKCINNLKNSAPNPNQIIDIISSMCKVIPVVIVIDEFGKNIEYFATDEIQESDLFLLQELAEMSGPNRKLRLFIMTLQHMAFEDYAVGASHARKKEWAKIQGRFEDIPFANSPDQTRQLVSNTIKIGKSVIARREIKKWANREERAIRDLGMKNLNSDLIASCYPLEPIVLEVLPELCSRYGQYERTLLSFITDGAKNTVASFIDEHTWDGRNPPTMGLDSLYDFFISGTTMIHSSSANITRLLEIETIIRDAHGLSTEETRTLKSIGILNLIGRSGYLRASQRLLEYVLKSDSTKQILKKLQDKSIITYRKHADEYRIWHGTDIDIASKLYICKKRYQNASLADMLNGLDDLDPIVAGKHALKFGTTRVFKRIFDVSSDIALDDSYDGVIVYKTGGASNLEYDGPLVTVTPRNLTKLYNAVLNVTVLRDILENDTDVSTDWVVRKELEERLSDEMTILERTFNDTFGDSAEWHYEGKKYKGSPSTIVSDICNRIYKDNPMIQNEMINKTVLSSQGNSARRKLLECMIAAPNKPRFGIEGFGPERAIYESMFNANKLHVSDSNMECKLTAPSKDNPLHPIWSAILDTLSKSERRVNLGELYHMCMMQPYGAKVGVIDILVVTISILHKNNIAIYEHGTYTPKITIEMVERLIKNPTHFDLKYFKSNLDKKKTLSTIIRDFGIHSEGSVLDVVSHLVSIIKGLDQYVTQTKNMDKGAIAVRDAVLNATEPDTLLFKSLPKALGFDRLKQSEIGKFSKALTRAKINLQNETGRMQDEIKDLLLTHTGMKNREKLSKTASLLMKRVSDQKMKVFLTAVASDSIERDADWINYVGLTLTNVPPSTWKDEHYDLFKNNLIDISDRFETLASKEFLKISSNLEKDACRVTLTNSDGSEHNAIVSLNAAEHKKVNALADDLIKTLKKKKVSLEYLKALGTVLIERT